MNDKAKIAALRAALKDIRANSTDNHAVITADRALTADDAEQAPEPEPAIDPLIMAGEQNVRQMLVDLHHEYRDRAEPLVKHLVAIESLKPRAHFIINWPPATPAPTAATTDSAPFGYIVRATCGDDKYRSIFRQRVFKSVHDQAQCYKQWLDQHADRLTPFNGIWWEVSEHTVYEVADSAADARDEEPEYELVQDDMLVAGTSGPRALEEIHHYATQYLQDGPVTIVKVSRTIVAAMHPTTGGK